MVAVREARKAFREMRARCFWSTPASFVLEPEDIPWIAERLVRYGGKRGWELAEKLRRCAPNRVTA